MRAFCLHWQTNISLRVRGLSDNKASSIEPLARCIRGKWGADAGRALKTGYLKWQPAAEIALGRFNYKQMHGGIVE